MEISLTLKTKLMNVFNLHSTENETVPANKILLVLNSAGLNIKSEKIPDVDMSFSDLKIFIENLEEDSLIQPDEILDAFKYFDEGNTGFVELTKIKHLLTKNEMEEIMRIMDIRDGKINYAKFIKLLD